MKLLVLGGTQFLGLQTVQAALDRGWAVTTFNRGKTRPEMFDGVEKLHGDRDGGLQALEGRTWDAVVDPSGYVPRLVRDSARLLSKACGHYTFVSSISVYSEPKAGIAEDGELATLSDASVEQVTGETYGGLKVLCEQAAEQEMPGRTLVVRPGLIVGPYDPTGRFTYWPLRAARGGRVLCPRADLPVQVIDGRDLASWTLDLVERGATGVYNGTGPERVLTMAETIEACAKGAGTTVEPVYADDEFLLAQNVGPWMQLPLWIPGDGGLMSVDVSKAFADGLRCRPLDEIARDTIASHARGETAAPEGVGLSAEREEELLAAWDARG